MNYYGEIKAQIVSSCATSGVAQYAGISLNDWTNYHIFSEEVKFIHGQNRGRCPFVNIKRKDSNYSYDAITTNDQGGMLVSDWEIEVVTGKNSNGVAVEETGTYKIAEAIVAEIRNKYNMKIGNQKIGSITTHPFGQSIIISLTIENTYSESEMR
jgi:hypothetical protein